jgi:PBP1b-binding outer membrane lipoprotein LpoB
MLCICHLEISLIMYEKIAQKREMDKMKSKYAALACIISLLSGCSTDKGERVKNMSISDEVEQIKSMDISHVERIPGFQGSTEMLNNDTE